MKNITLNVNCTQCSKLIHRSNSAIKKYEIFFCSKECQISYYNGRKITKFCKTCQSEFNSEKRSAKYCCIKCRNIGRRGLKYSGTSCGNKSRQRLNLLRNTFNFKSCMIIGCEYNKTYDIHRMIPGKDGGEYIIGNMFAICPLHHAEVTRNIIVLEKINDYTLSIKASI